MKAQPSPAQPSPAECPPLNGSLNYLLDPAHPLWRPLGLCLCLTGAGCGAAEALLSETGERLLGELDSWMPEAEESDLPSAYDYNPHPFGTQTAYLQVAVGDAHVCALRLDGEIDCVGLCANGELHAPAGPWTQVWASSYVSCGLKEDGQLSCWGTKTHGLARLLSAWPQDPPWTDFHLGDQANACGTLAGGDLACIASADYDYVLPGPLLNLEVIKANKCALDAEGLATCWGPSGESRALGTDPGWIPPEEALIDVTAAEGGACGLRPDRSIVCWGSERGLVSPVAGRVFELGGDVQDILFMSESGICGRDSLGLVTCSGAPKEGPPPDEALIDWDYGGGGFACGRDEGGVVHCWGRPPAHREEER